MEVAVARQHLGGERLVQLDHVDAIERELVALEQLAYRGHRADPHARRVHAHRDVAEQRGLRRHAVTRGGRLGHHHYRSRAVGDGGGVAGGDRPVLPEHGLELRHLLERGVGA